MRIKICGLTRLDDVRLAAVLGADFLGFVFAESPRRVTVQAAGEILRTLEREQPDVLLPVQRVGVFVNAERALIEEAAAVAGLTMLQLHGDEDPDFCNTFRLHVIKALRVKDRGVVEQIGRYTTPYILLEPYLNGKYGGTGQQADWQLAAELVRAFPEKSFFLAGGLGPGNVRTAVATVQPFAVDASSALESSPGVKDPQKLRAFIEAARRR